LIDVYDKSTGFIRKKVRIREKRYQKCLFNKTSFAGAGKASTIFWMFTGKFLFIY
jgi:hypothetical protein